MRKLLVVAAVMALLAAACSEDEDTTTTAAAQTTTTAAAQTTTTAAPETTTTAAPAGVNWAGIVDPSHYQAVNNGVMTPETISMNRELYGQLLEVDASGAPMDGAVIFGELLPGVSAGCTHLRGQLITSLNPQEVTEAVDLGGGTVDFERSRLIKEGDGRYVIVYEGGAEPLEVVNTHGDQDEVSLHYVLLPTPRWKWAPDNDATSISDPGDPANQFAGTASVAVIDAFGEQPILEGVHSPANRHGEFITGVITRFAPGVKLTQVDPSVTFTSGRSVISEVSLHEKVVENDEVLTSIINASFGVYPCPDGANDPILPALLASTIQILVGDDRLLIAAAGNDDLTDVLFYPAGYSIDSELGAQVVSVGACDMSAVTLTDSDDGCENHPAGFSNDGAWVEVWAPGVNIPGQFVDGVTMDPVNDVIEIPHTYADSAGNPVDPQLQDDAIGQLVKDQSPFAAGHIETVQPGGFAQWSGTSFAAPHVVAAIAGHGDPPLAACETLFGQSVCSG